MSQKTFAYSSYQANVRTLSVNLPKEIRQGQAQLAIVRHFRDNNVSLVDMFMIFDVSGTKGFAPIIKNSESGISLDGVEATGTQATLTFSTNVYASCYVIALV